VVSSVLCLDNEIHPSVPINRNISGRISVTPTKEILRVPKKVMLHMGNMLVHASHKHLHIVLPGTDTAYLSGELFS